jgi:hypothetical protein
LLIHETLVISVTAWSGNQTAEFGMIDVGPNQWALILAQSGTSRDLLNDGVFDLFSFIFSYMDFL